MMSKICNTNALGSPIFVKKIPAPIVTDQIYLRMNVAIAGSHNTANPSDVTVEMKIFGLSNPICTHSSHTACWQLA